MGEDPAAPNYDPEKKLIRSMINGSSGPLLRQATALDWVGDPFDTTGFVALHGESTYAQFLEHYREYTDVVGDHFLNLVATTLPTNAYLLTGEAKYRRWIVDYMDAWLARMKQNGGIIPSFVDLDGTIGGRGNRWWGNAYGWGFSPVNPVTGRREDRNRIPRALVGFSNALLVTGDREICRRVARDDRRRQRARARRRRPQGVSDDGRRRRLVRLAAASRGTSARSRCGTGRCARPIARASAPIPGSTSSTGRTPATPRRRCERDIDSIPRKLATIRADRTPPDKRLADNMLDSNPAATDALVRLMLGRARAGPRGRPPQRAPALLRSGAPARRRAGGCRGAGLGARRSADGRHARQPEPDRIAHGDRAGGRLRRASVRIGRVERTHDAAWTRETSPCSSRRAPAPRSRWRPAATSTSRRLQFPWDR